MAWKKILIVSCVTPHVVLLSESRGAEDWSHFFHFSSSVKIFCHFSDSVWNTQRMRFEFRPFFSHVSGGTLDKFCWPRTRAKIQEKTPKETENDIYTHFIYGRVSSPNILFMAELFLYIVMTCIR